MENEEVEDHFTRQVAQYEELMERIIPWYGPGQGLMADLIPFGREEPLRVLDLGSGPCNLAVEVLARFPRAKVHALDLTGAMLDACRSRLAAFKGRWTVQQGDIREADFGDRYDVVLAGLALHHLNVEERRALYGRLRWAINPGGLLVVREVLVEADSRSTAWHHRLWRAFMQARGEDGDFWIGKHWEKDHPQTLEDIFHWVKEAGFEWPACHWRQHNFAIHTAMVPEAG